MAITFIHTLVLHYPNESLHHITHLDITHYKTMQYHPPLHDIQQYNTLQPLLFPPYNIYTLLHLLFTPIHYSTPLTHTQIPLNNTNHYQYFYTHISFTTITIHNLIFFFPTSFIFTPLPCTSTREPFYHSNLIQPHPTSSNLSKPLSLTAPLSLDIYHLTFCTFHLTFCTFHLLTLQFLLG